jgi:DNA repair protein SbcD/Mre11
VTFRFLHTADLHLNSPFIGLALRDEALAKRLAAASREAFSDLITKAIEAGVAFVVIAGDVYDGEWKDTSIGLFFNREIGRLERAGIPVYLVKGNHDAESVVTKAIKPRGNVNVFSSAKAETFQIQSLKVALHGRSFPDRAVDENYVLTYPEPTPGWFNIGVLHTSCSGRPDHANYAPCTARDLANRGYDYWALGHIHEYEELSRDPWIVFPGNLQGRSMRECGPKGAVIVEVKDGRVTDVPRVIVDRARWAVVRVDVGDVFDEGTLLLRIQQEIRSAINEAGGRLLAFRVCLEGRTPLDRHLRSDVKRFADETQAVAQGLHEDVWLERLLVETEDTYKAPKGPDELAASLDLSAVMRELVHDADFRLKASELIASISSKTPAGIVTGEAPLAEDLDRLLTEASATIMARMTHTEKAATQCV